MTMTTTRRSILAGAACLPALAVPAFAEVAIPTSDPVLAAIERHRRLNKEYCALNREQDELYGRLPDDAGRQPRVAVYPKRDGKAVMVEESDDHLVIRHDHGPVLIGQYHYATTIDEIKRCATSIPKEHREVWLADRIRAFRIDQRAVATARRKAGYTQIVKREEVAGNAEFNAGQKLLATVPATIAGTLALVRYALESLEAGDGLILGDDNPSILLRSVAAALDAAVLS
jgi:hypothetical protein